jgi:hypothetical protein
MRTNPYKIPQYRLLTACFFVQCIPIQTSFLNMVLHGIQGTTGQINLGNAVAGRQKNSDSEDSRDDQGKPRGESCDGRPF